MRLHILVEGTSEEALLKVWLGRLLPGHRIRIYPHRGKGRIPAKPNAKPLPHREGLLDQLPAKLRSFGNELNPDTDRVIVLVDTDNDDCKVLKNKMVTMLRACTSASKAVVCIAVEEMEAFYLGDPEAIRRAYPKAKLNRLRDYEPDSVVGTWELFQRVIDSPIEDKVAWAKTMGQHLAVLRDAIARSTSPSFKHFCTVMLRAAGEPGMGT